MVRRMILVAAATVALAGAALAQAPYAGQQARPIKALSDQQIADLRAGRGMGMALPAELNGYPGPVHLLELADSLGLSPAQRSAVQSLFEAMKAESIPIGERLIEQEGALDRLFAERRATGETVTAAVADIAETQGRLRATHLKYHLSTLALLQPQQIERYGELRGYGGHAPAPHRHR
jgi:hypothetical protein